MQNIVVLFSLMTVAYAGVGVVTPEIEAEALALWQKHCEGAGEGGADGGLFIYCKKSQDNIEENLQHAVELTASGPPQDQIVFVQPPSYHYKHDVIVSGGGASAPKTVIYVKPAKNTHEVSVNDQTSGAAAPQKPTLYFLKGNHGAEEPLGARSRRDHVAASTGNDDPSTSESEVSEISAPQPSESAESAPRKQPVIYILKRRTAGDN